MYKKAHDFLAAEFGSVCYVYDRWESALMSARQSLGTTNTAPAVVRLAGTLWGLTRRHVHGSTCTTVLQQNL